MSKSLFIYKPACLSFCLSVHLFSCFSLSLSLCLSFRLYICTCFRLAKKFVWVFLHHLMEKLERTLWPTQYMCVCIYVYIVFGERSDNWYTWSDQSLLSPWWGQGGSEEKRSLTAWRDSGENCASFYILLYCLLFFKISEPVPFILYSRISFPKLQPFVWLLEPPGIWN